MGSELKDKIGSELKDLKDFSFKDLKKHFTDPPDRYILYGAALSRALPTASVRAKRLLTLSTAALIAVQGAATFVFSNEDKYKDEPANQMKYKAVKTLDLLLWHGVASVILPTVVAEVGTRVSDFLTKTSRACPSKSRYVPLGLACLLMPIICPLVDPAVTYAMDNTIRKIYYTEDELKEEKSEREKKK